MRDWWRELSSGVGLASWGVWLTTNPFLLLTRNWVYFLMNLGSELKQKQSSAAARIDLWEGKRFCSERLFITKCQDSYLLETNLKSSEIGGDICRQRKLLPNSTRPRNIMVHAICCVLLYIPASLTHVKYILSALHSQSTVLHLCMYGWENEHKESLVCACKEVKLPCVHLHAYSCSVGRGK